MKTMALFVVNNRQFLSFLSFHSFADAFVDIDAGQVSWPLILCIPSPQTFHIFMQSGYKQYKNEKEGKGSEA